MESFSRYFQKRMQDPVFKVYYEKECHVCAQTMAIFETLDRGGTSIAEISRDVGARPEVLTALRDADHCDPDLVIRLCAHLGLTPPVDCPRARGKEGGFTSGQD